MCLQDRVLTRSSRTSNQSANQHAHKIPTPICICPSNAAIVWLPLTFGDDGGGFLPLSSSNFIRHVPWRARSHAVTTANKSRTISVSRRRPRSHKKRRGAHAHPSTDAREHITSPLQRCACGPGLTPAALNATRRKPIRRLP